MSIDPAEFRRVLGHFASGVTVVTARDPDSERPIGLTVSAFASLSLDPTLVLICVEQGADSHDYIARSRHFAVNMLDEHGELLARRFASDDADGRFEGVAHRVRATGAPVLDDALAWVDCTLHECYHGGDHTIYVGEVVAADARDGGPLLFYRGGYARLVP